MTRFLLLLFSLIFISQITHAVNLRGLVTDATTNEPLVGASVFIVNTSFGTSVGLDGSYVIKGIPSGMYAVRVSMIGFQTTERQVSLTIGKDVSLNFSLAEDANQLDEIFVKGIADNQSEYAALKSEQNADNVVNIISANAIQMLPDITVGNLLQRVSGVSIARNGSGDGQYAIIRGMDKRYNYTLVNGIKIPSPDDKNRYVPMDIFPSDLLERLEVVKALTPNMEGDAIGGAMNMIMKSAPDYLTISASAAGGYSQLFNDRPFSGFSINANQLKSPSESHGDNQYGAPASDFSVKPLQYKDVKTPVNSQLNFSIGNRVFNHKLGIFLGGSFQHSYRGSNTIFYRPNAEPGVDPIPNSPILPAVEKRRNSNEQTRIGSNFKLDYDLGQNSKISLLGLFMQLEDWQHRNLQNNALTLIGDASISERSVYRKQNIYNTTLQGDHLLLDKLKVNWSTVYSQAASTRPAWSDQSVTYKTTQDLDGNIVETGRYLGSVSQRWTHNEDRDMTGYVNLTYNLLPTLELATGGMYRDKERSNYYNNYSFSTAIPNVVLQPYTSIDQATLSFNDPLGNLGFASYTDANNYKAQEKIGAAYVQGKFTISKLQILGGVRFENTKIFMETQVPVTQAGRVISNNYTDVLPSVHFKYSLTERENLRLSYFKGISRPSFAELNPGLIQGDYFNESGNPKIKHVTADNFDLRYEFFPGGNNQLLIGTFYKRIQNPIEYGFDIKSQVRTDYTPQNFGTATNYGFEFVFAKYFKNFGVSGNYTYTQSRITTTKLISGRESYPGGAIVKTQENQTRPLQGQSNHIANLSIIYKNQKIGFNTQLAWVYTGSRINIVSPYKDLDYWQRGNSQLSFSADKRLGRNFSLFLKIANLLNNPIIVDLLKPNTFSGYPEQTRTDRILVQKDIFQQSYLLGVRFKY